MATLGGPKGPVIDLELEGRLKPVRPLPQRKTDRRYGVTLLGGMTGYVWGIDGADNLKVKHGERVEIAMRNMSMMTHPMQLHGLHFQIVEINGSAIRGAVRDTVAAPPITASRLLSMRTTLDAGPSTVTTSITWRQA